MLQDVLARLDKTYQAFFRRVQRGEKAGFPRFKGRNRFHSFTFKEYGNGARLDNGVLVLSKIGRISVHWSRPIEGTPKTVTISKEADGWYVAISCAEVPVQPLPATGQETGIDLGLESFATLADGQRDLHPTLLPQGRSVPAPLPAACRPAQEGQPSPTQSGGAAGQSASAYSQASGATSTTKRRAKLVQAYDAIYYEDLRVRQHGQEPPSRQEHQLMPGGARSCHPYFQGCKRREASASGQPCVHQPGLFGLWRDRAERLVRALARLPGLWNEPAPGPQRRA